MKKYEIVVSYSTGNFFGSHDTEDDTLNCEWNDLAIAKENLVRIREHYDLFKKLDKFGVSKEEKLKLIEENKTKPWFRLEEKPYCISRDCRIERSEIKKYEGDWEMRPDMMAAELSIVLKTDEGEDFVQSCFWHGYFERLHTAEIKHKTKEDDGMRIDF